MRIIFALTAILASHAFCLADPLPEPWNVRIEVQMVAMPEALALPLIAEFADEKTVEAAYAFIQDRLKEGPARLVGWPIVTTKRSQRAVIEAIDEYRFASEFAPPVVQFRPNVAPSDPPEPAPKTDMSVLAATPVACETRNTGVIFEVEPVLSPDKTRIGLNLVPQHLRLKRLNKTTVENQGNGTKVIEEQPEFGTMKVATSITLRSGQRTLFGIFRAHEPAGHLKFFILKAEAMKVE